jgi:hypothetical protein
MYVRTTISFWLKLNGKFGNLSLKRLFPPMKSIGLYSVIYLGALKPKNETTTPSIRL